MTQYTTLDSVLYSSKHKHFKNLDCDFLS